MRRALKVVVYMLEVVDGVRCVPWVLGFMLCMLLCILETMGSSPFGRGDGGDTLCAALYAGSRGGWTLFARGAEGVGGDVLCAALYIGDCRWRAFEIPIVAGSEETNESR